MTVVGVSDMTLANGKKVKQKLREGEQHRNRDASVICCFYTTYKNLKKLASPFQQIKRTKKTGHVFPYCRTSPSAITDSPLIPKIPKFTQSLSLCSRSSLHCLLLLFSTLTNRPERLVWFSFSASQF